MGKKTPKIAPSFWDFVTLPEEDRATTTVVYVIHWCQLHQ